MNSCATQHRRPVLSNFSPLTPTRERSACPKSEEHARVIATGQSKVTGRPFNLVVAFESSTDDHGNQLGRGIAESSFHHFVDYNWDTEMGCPSFLVEPPGDGYKRNPQALQDIKTYVGNAARWLARRSGLVQGAPTVFDRPAKTLKAMFGPNEPTTAYHKGAVNTILKDSYGRAIRDLRVSLTDRCNFRCFYCLPHGEPPIAPKEQMLSYEEIEYVCDIFVSLGIEKIRLTGGEPMMRRDIETIIEKLSQLKQKGLLDLALTTNAYFLPEHARLERRRTRSHHDQSG